MFLKKEKNILTEAGSRPKQLVIGFYSSIKKKDLESYIYGRASNGMSLRNCHFNILKYRDGYVWELHEGGDGKGVISSVISLLESSETVIVNLDDRQMRLSKKHNGNIACYLINEDDRQNETEGVAFTDDMKLVVTRGYGLYAFSKWLLISSIFALFLSMVFKYVIYNQRDELLFPNSAIEMPHTKIPEIKSAMMEHEVYVSNITFKNKKWEINKEKETVQSDASNNSADQGSGINESAGPGKIHPVNSLGNKDDADVIDKVMIDMKQKMETRRKNKDAQRENNK